MSTGLSVQQQSESIKRCRRHRRRILDVSQKVDALHVAPAFSCLELVDAVLNYCVDQSGGGPDVFILSKGHGAMAQYVVLEDLGVLDPAHVNRISQSGSTVGGHPDRGTPGVVASTGSLGHGLPLALGIARGLREHETPASVYVVMSDGELMEGSVWEALLLGPSLGITNVTAIIDHNGSISRGEIMKVQPNLIPVAPKLQAFGWDTRDVDGHDSAAIVDALRSGTGSAPLAIIARTTKGKGVSYMENQPIWAYRSPSPDEYHAALSELVDPGDSHA
jgi:transketolase